MAEVLGLAASIVAVLQVTDKVIELCKFYIEATHGAPSDLRAILIETSATKSILENLQFLVSCDGEMFTAPDGSSRLDGPIQGCQSAITDLERLFPPHYTQGSSINSHSKSHKLKTAWTALAWPLKENKARKLLENLIQHKITLNLILTTESISDMKDIKRQTENIHNIVTDDQKQDIYKWLEGTDPSPLHHLACRQYESGTGDWILRSPKWIDWMSNKSRILWIHGIPGAGKTVLFSHLVEEIQRHVKGSKPSDLEYVYYYCYFGHNQDEAIPFLKWTISQLCRKADLVPKYLYKLHRRGGQPSLEELLQALDEALHPFDNVAIAIDAVDESMPREDLLRVLRDLATDPRFDKVQLLATSREYIDIENILLPISTPVSMSNPWLEEDIKLYVSSQMRKRSRLKSWPPQLQDEVLEVLSTKARGMFRWAVCQLDVLQRLKGDLSVVKNALGTLPKTLDETYERIFLQIPDEQREFVHHALKWLYYVLELDLQNLTSTVLLQAIEISTSHSIIATSDYVFDEELLREFCGCLITIEPREQKSRVRSKSDKQVVSFAHYTVVEFLTSNRIVNNRAAFFAIDQMAKFEMTRIAIQETLKIDRDMDPAPNSLDESFACFCALISVRCLSNRSQWLSQVDQLANLAFDLLDSSKPHFHFVESFLGHSDVVFDYFSDKFNLPHLFWQLNWLEPPEYHGTEILAGLLTIGVDRTVVEKLVETKSPTQLFQSTLALSISKTWDREDFDFRGSITQLFACLDPEYGASLSHLLELGTKFFDPSMTLLFHVGSHVCDRNCLAVFYQLLQNGANPNIPGSLVTPLQITVAYSDLERTEALLAAGADPNDAGDLSAESWEFGMPLSRFNSLAGFKPLHIYRDPIHCGITRLRFDNASDRAIEQLLLKYGALEY